MVSNFMRPALLVASIGLAGCSLVYGDTLDAQQCKKHEDCDTPATVGKYSCIDNACLDVACDNPVCTSAQTCFRGACVAAACTSDLTCGDGNRCGYDGFCYSTWGCLNTEKDWPKPPKIPFHVKTQMRRLDLAPVTDLDAVACIVEDPNCERPLVPGSQITLDPNGVLDVPFTTMLNSADGFTGLIKITPRQAGAWLPMYLFSPGVSPWADEYVSPNEASLITPEIIGLLNQALATTVNKADPLFTIMVNDCGGRPVPGISVTFKDPNTTAPRFVQFYPVGEGNSPEKPETVGELLETTTRGLGFMLTLPVGLVSVELKDGDRSVSEVAFVAKADALNSVIYFPRYSAVQLWMTDYKKRQANGGVATP